MSRPYTTPQYTIWRAFSDICEASKPPVIAAPTCSSVPEYSHRMAGRQRPAKSAMPNASSSSSQSQQLVKRYSWCGQIIGDPSKMDRHILRSGPGPASASSSGASDGARRSGPAGPAPNERPDVWMPTLLRRCSLAVFFTSGAIAALSIRSSSTSPSLRQPGPIAQELPSRRKSTALPVRPASVVSALARSLCRTALSASRSARSMA